MSKILIVDDDQNLLELLAFALTREGYDVVKVQDGNQAIGTWRSELPDLVVLDANIPQRDGFEICRQARMDLNLHTPVIMLTARTREEDMAQGFQVGADDYVTKPFSPRLLLARIGAVLRRGVPTGSQSLGTEQLSVGGVQLDPSKQEVERNGKRSRLTPTEFRLMHLLVQNRNQVVRSDTILERVWGYDARGDTGSLKAHIRHLREKVETYPSRPELILTVPGVGYMCRLRDGDR